MSLKLVKDDVRQLNTNVVRIETADLVKCSNDEVKREDSLRGLVKSSLQKITDNSFKSVAFSLKDFKGFPRSYGLKILIDEVKELKLDANTDIYISTLDEKTLCYEDKPSDDFGVFASMAMPQAMCVEEMAMPAPAQKASRAKSAKQAKPKDSSFRLSKLFGDKSASKSAELDYDEEIDESALDERVRHITDPFGVYLLYLADRKGVSLTQLENTAWVSKHVVHDINKKPEVYKPSKRTAFQLCVGLELSLDDTRDLLMRAGYAISTSVLEDRIWEFFIENEHYDIIDISDSLEKYDLKPIIEF